MQRVTGVVRHSAKVDRIRKLTRRQDEIGWKVLLVVLNDDRNSTRIHVLLREILVKVLKALDVLLQLSRLAVGDEHDAVRALQHELAGRVVVDLPGNGVELEACSESGNRAELERQEMKGQRTLRLRSKRHHFP